MAYLKEERTEKTTIVVVKSKLAFDQAKNLSYGSALQRQDSIVQEQTLSRHTKCTFLLKREEIDSILHCSELPINNVDAASTFTGNVRAYVLPYCTVEGSPEVRDEIQAGQGQMRAGHGLQADGVDAAFVPHLYGFVGRGGSLDLC